MAHIGHDLRQAFMQKHECGSLREEEKGWGCLQRSLVTALASIVCFAILAAVSVSTSIVFPGEIGWRPFCRDRRFSALTVREPDVHLYRGTFYLTDEEAADFYWMVVFIPSAIVFFASVVYLLAGMAVAYSAPTRHMCLCVVENNYCASRRGSSLLTLGSSCSIPLFWCYEIASWGLVILYGGTAFFLRRKAVVIHDQGDFAGQNIGLEMLESNEEVTPDMALHLNEGFKAWMGSSLLSSDNENGPDDYIEEGLRVQRIPNQQQW